VHQTIKIPWPISPREIVLEREFSFMPPKVIDGSSREVYSCIFICLYWYVHINVHVYLYVCIYESRDMVLEREFNFIPPVDGNREVCHMYIYMYIYMYMYICIFILVCAHKCTCVFIYVYI
jgi:hypothetical protein